MALRVLSQGVLVELARVLKRFIKRFVLIFWGFPAAAGVIFGYFKAHALRKALDRLAEIEPLVVHHEPKRVTPGATTKAVVELPLGVHREGRRFLVVKGAAGAVVLARFLELHAAINDLDDIKAIQ